MSRILVVDDEENIRLVLVTLLKQHGYTVEVAASAEEALELHDSFSPLFILADVRMPGMSGIEMCQALRQKQSDATVIVMSAFGSVDLALEAMNAGAYDYISKPFKKDEVILALRKAEEREALRQSNRELRRAAQQATRFDSIVGASEPMRKLFAMIDKVAAYNTTVLIQGESGTGKELVAAAIHRRSDRGENAFVAVNCGAIPESLIESQLFGHKKGAFTDASSDRIGLFEEADGGTLFLDEIGELPQGVQVKLLRALQEGRVRPVGGTQDVELDVRIVAATLKNLEQEVDEGRFREDLFYRLNVVQLRVVPLRERKEDIPLLLDYFFDSCAQKLGTKVRGVTPAAKKILMNYGWPGNVRELENFVERASVLCDGALVTPEELPERVRDPQDPVKVFLASGELSIKKSQLFLEDQLIRKVLEKTGGNRTAAAKILEIQSPGIALQDQGLRYRFITSGG